MRREWGILLTLTMIMVLADLLAFLPTVRNVSIACVNIRLPFGRFIFPLTFF